MVGKAGQNSQMRCKVITQGVYTVATNSGMYDVSAMPIMAFPHTRAHRIPLLEKAESAPCCIVKEVLTGRIG